MSDFQRVRATFQTGQIIPHVLFLSFQAATPLSSDTRDGHLELQIVQDVVIHQSIRSITWFRLGQR